jgi:hypothetical protein
VNAPLRFSDTVQPEVFDLRMFGPLGVNARGPSSEEAVAAFMGRYLYSDLPGSLDRYRDDRSFAATRVDIATVSRLVQNHAAVFGAADANQAGAMADALNQSAARYFTLTQAAEMDPGGFRRYLESTPQEQAALAHIQKLEGLLASLRNLGLPPVEYNQARERLLASVSSRRLTPQLLAKVVEKPQS